MNKILRQAKEMNKGTFGGPKEPGKVIECNPAGAVPERTICEFGAAK